MAKLHIGFIGSDKALENEIKSSFEDLGGCYLHSSGNTLEMVQKLGLQKVNLVIVDKNSKSENSDISGVVNFIRSKKELSTIPILFLGNEKQLKINYLFKDKLVRYFSKSMGLFLAMLTMKELLGKNANDISLHEEITSEWIDTEFLICIKSKLGQGLEFEVRPPNEDELHASVFCQSFVELRTHIGWFKFNARLIETNKDGLSKLFQGMTSDMIEQVAQNILQGSIDDLQTKVSEEFSTKGAIYLPEVENMPAIDRKAVYGSAKHTSHLFYAKECSIILERSKYI